MDLNAVLEDVKEDDFVEYFLFPQSTIHDKKEEELMINSVLKEAKAVLKKHCRNYLWHKDEFTLSARTSISNFLCNENARENLPCHLYGSVHFGDYIEDEWFIVYLLVQLSKEIDDLICRVVDADGEFLLIEAADHLPAWAKPETCDKRVYIYKGQIHIIAPEATTDDDADCESPPDVHECLKTIRLNPSLTVASPQIQSAIAGKIKDYPAKITANLHRCTVYLPIALATMLKTKPNLVSAAVHAFVNRDSIDMRACRAMKFYPPESRVYTSLTFTRCLYAMLTHSKYLPDRKTGWSLPASTDDKYKSHLLGVKVACGFEILAAQAKKCPSVDDFESEKGWHTYLNSLKSKGYFGELLEHSNEYNSLLGKAKDYYKEHRDTMYRSPTLGSEIVALTRNVELNPDEFGDLSTLPADDDESWLNIAPDELDQMLREQYGQKNVHKFSEKSDAGAFTSKLNTFLSNISDLDGAEFPRNDKITTTAPAPSAGNKISFDANNFSSAVQNILNFVIPDDDTWDLESDSDMDDYAHEERDGDELKEKMKDYMRTMDAELATTTLAQSFETMTTKCDDFDDIETFKPVDIDMNALKNILESYKLQMGEAGPSSNMLGPMGVHLDQFNCDSDD